MAVYERIVKAQDGKSLYRNKTDDKVVDEKDLKSALKEELDLADPGTEIDEETVFAGDGDGVEGAGKKDGDDQGDDEETLDAPKATKPRAGSVTAGKKAADAAKKAAKDNARDKSNKEADEAAKAANSPYQRAVPQSEPGMGFKRVGGKTVDIFDQVTPHTHIRPVEGFVVPLSEKNHREKSDAEIYERLKELGYV